MIFAFDEFVGEDTIVVVEAEYLPRERATKTCPGRDPKVYIVSVTTLDGKEITASKEDTDRFEQRAWEEAAAINQDRADYIAASLEGR